MKMKTLLASGLCFALTVPALAQEEKKEMDSIYITPFTGARIILVGKGMEKLLKENNLEVLKNKFVEDYQESAKDKDFPATAKNIIYLAGADGRRRLKAIPDEAAPVNVKEEIKAFNSNLPPFHYTIYDLTKNYRYHIYMQEPGLLDSLGKVNSDSLLKTATNSTNRKDYRLTNSVEVKPDRVGFFMSGVNKQQRQVILGLTPYFGIGLINSALSPTVGFSVSSNFFNKYGNLRYEVGARLNTYILADYANRKFSNFYPINSYSLYLMHHFGNSGAGLSIGYFTDGRDEDATSKGSLNKAWKFGFLSEHDRFGLEYNFIYDKQKKTSTALTLHYYL